MTIATRRVSPVKVARTASGMTQFDLALAAEISESAVSRLETGRGVPSESARKKIASVLGIHTWEVN